MHLLLASALLPLFVVFFEYVENPQINLEPIRDSRFGLEPNLETFGSDTDCIFKKP